MRRWLRPVLVVTATALIAAIGVQSASAHSTYLANVTIKSVVDNPTTVITPPPMPPDNGGSSSQPIQGTTQPNSKVTIYDNGQAVATGQSDGDGNFSIDTPLKEGQNQIEARTSNGQPSNQITINRQGGSWWHRYGRWLALSCLLIIVLVGGGWWLIAAKRRKDDEGANEGQDGQQIF